MVKRIILFSDGTGNSSASFFKTNVWRMYDALDLSTDMEQVAYFDDGVGSSSDKRIAAITGSVGIGLKRNVLDLYKFLSREYANALQDLYHKYSNDEPDPYKIPQEELPKISCFGFSRGAFTVRVLAGLVYSQGLLTRASEAEMDWLAQRAYAEFRRIAFKTKYGLDWLYRPPYHRTLELLDKIKLSENKRYDVQKNLLAVGSPSLKDSADGIVKFDFLGVWDTVGAYGMPLEEFRIAIDNWIFPLTFTDQNPLKCVKYIRHALSIDDDRDAFTPIAFWDSDLRKESRIMRNELFHKAIQNNASKEEAMALAWKLPEPCLQMWFAGVHSNVGGGYPDDSMAFEPLRWMLEQAINCDAIKVRQSARIEIKRKATPFGQVYDSRSGFGGLYRYKPRNFDEILLPEGVIKTFDHLPIIHKSALFRAADSYYGYAPIALPEELLVADDDGRIIYHHNPTLDSKEPIIKINEDRDIGIALSKVNPPTQSQRELVETAVFWRRFVYYITIYSFLILLSLPLLDHDASTIEDDNVISTFFEFIGGFTPSFTQPWIMSFRVYPTIAASLVAVFVSTFWWGSKLKTLVDDRSRAAWDTSSRNKNKIFPQGPIDKVFDEFAKIILGFQFLRKIWQWLTVKFIPTIVAIIIVFFVIATVADRITYQSRSVFGFVCEDSKKAIKPVGDNDIKLRFRIDSPCNQSGVQLIKGHYYHLNLQMGESSNERSINNDTKWLDLNHEANFSGLDQSQFLMSDKIFYFFAAPLRRTFSQPWFKPILRIGAKGFTEIPVDPDIPFSAGFSKEKLEMTFRAPANGELFFYVNDAYAGILPIGLFACRSYNPEKNGLDWLWNTYCNNRGLVTGTISNANDLQIKSAKWRN